MGTIAPTLASDSNSIGDKAGSILSGALDTGLTAVGEVGVFTGTDANPADVDDLGGQSGQVGVAAPSKTGAKVIGKGLKTAVNFVTPAAISVNGVVGENDVKGVEIGAGVGVGSTVDIQEAKVSVVKIME